MTKQQAPARTLPLTDAERERLARAYARLILALYTLRREQQGHVADAA